jgi:hypothetical protein
MQRVGRTDCGEHNCRYLRVLAFVLGTKYFPSLISSRNEYLTNWVDRSWIAALFWVIIQRIVAIPYRRFGATSRSHLEDDSDMLPRNVGKELPFLVEL